LTLSVILVAAQYVAIGKLMVLPVLRPLLFAWAFFFIAACRNILRERREREYAVREFSRFLIRHVVKEIMAHGGLSREGESRQVHAAFFPTSAVSQRYPNRGLRGSRQPHQQLLQPTGCGGIPQWRHSG